MILYLILTSVVVSEEGYVLASLLWSPTCWFILLFVGPLVIETIHENTQSFILPLMSRTKHVELFW